jgi:serine beta-lactamase-like protein LACTB, mitochondrial
MKIARWAALAVGVLSAACSPGRVPLPVTASVASAAYAPASDSARVLLRRAARAGAGVSLAVMRHGEPIWVEGVGYADLAARTPVDPASTRFRIYGVTKAMTAAAAGRLMERRSLDPSAPVQRYVPSFPEKSAPITPMMLATHTSGIRHYVGDEATSLRHCATTADALPIFENDPLVHAPGAKETYSSWGFVLLSAVIEGASGEDYVAAMRRLVFTPAGMTRTTIDDPTRDVSGRTSFYEEAGGRVRPAQRVDNTCKWGAGSLLSTAPDVAAFGAAMLDGTLLSDRTLALFFRGRDTYEVQGVGAGGTAFLIVDRSADLSVALLANVSGNTAGPSAKAAAEGIRDLFSAASRTSR